MYINAAKTAASRFSKRNCVILNKIIIVPRPVKTETTLPAIKGSENIFKKGYVSQIKRGCFPSISEINKYFFGSKSPICAHLKYIASSVKIGIAVKLKHLVSK